MNQKSWMALFAILLLAGAGGAINVLIQGHSAFGTTDELPWGILISTYVFFVVSSTGLCLVSSLGHVFHFNPFGIVAKRAILLAIITLLAGFVTIGLELGHPLHMIYVLLTPNFSSAIFWMGALYGLYMVLLIGEFWYLNKEEYARARVWGMAGFLSAIVAHSNLGAVFGLLHARPFWEGPYLPIYFILSALLSGTAILIVMYYLKERNGEPSPIVPALAKLMTLFVCITIFFTSWKIISGLYGHPHGKYQALQALFSGPLSVSFWSFEVGLGMAAPLVLLLMFRSRKSAFWASVMALTGIFFMRYNLVIAGQIVPLDVLDMAAPVGKYLSYSPTWSELAIVAGGFGLTGFVYLLGERKLNLESPVDTHDSPAVVSAPTAISK